MGKKVTDDILGIDPPSIPEAPTVPVAPPKREDLDKLPDQEAVRASKERIEQMKRRRGRSSLRTDLSTTLGGAGAGIAIPR